MKKQIFDIRLKRDELHSNLGGGLPAGGLLLIEGKDGGGKSVIAQRLTFGLLQNGSTVSYISTELNLMGFIQQMDSLDYRITEEVLSEKLIFISMFPQIGNVRLKENFMDDLLTNKKIFSSDIICFDTISFLLLNEKITREVIFNLVSFIKKITALGKTLVICIDPDQCNKQFLDIIRNIADGYLFCEAKMVLGNLLHIINVVRYKKAIKEVSAAMPFKVIPGAGFAIELASLA
jgi:flagellar protein FlaH